MSSGLDSTEKECRDGSRGRVILLNGCTSAGKSSVAKVLQATLPTAHMNIGIDDFLEKDAQRLICRSELAVES
jgi:chloramphenicol 3-O-phosphotransferase